MKKLLCVLMFGMVLGQDAITTRDYEIPINFNQMNSSWENADNGGGEEFDLSEYIDFPSGSIYEVERVGYFIDSIETFGSGSCSFQYHFSFDMININSNLNIGELYLGNQTSNSGYFTSNNASFNTFFMGGCDPDASLSITATLTIRISGKWGDEGWDDNGGLQGDMNGDDNLDVLDVVMLVDVILEGGIGDIGELLNIVTG